MTGSGFCVDIPLDDSEKFSFVSSFRVSRYFYRELNRPFFFNGETVGKSLKVILKLDDGNIIQSVDVNSCVAYGWECD